MKPGTKSTGDWSNVWAADKGSAKCKKTTWRKAEFKARHMSGKDSRRKMLLEAQKKRRIDAQQHARRIVHDTEHNKWLATDIQKKDWEKVTQSMNTEARKKRYSYAKQLMYPQWMDELPNLHNWYALPRPEGVRCLIISFRGYTRCRKKNGSIWEEFPSALPNGNHAKPLKKNGYCILDCIYNDYTETFYVIDMMCWKGFAIYDCETEMRFFWIQSRLSETTVATVDDNNWYKFCPIPFFRCTPDSFHLAYPTKEQIQHYQQRKCLTSSTTTTTTTKTATTKKTMKPEKQNCENSAMEVMNDDEEQFSQPCMSQHGYPQDGILFYHMSTRYVMESTPLVLLWKDENCSRYFLDRNNGENPSPLQKVVLSVHRDEKVGGYLKTKEDIIVGHLPSSFFEQASTFYYDTMLLKFTITGYELENDSTMHDITNAIKLQGLKYLGPASRMRILPDSMSKIIFQYKARRRENITLDDILKRINQPHPVQYQKQQKQRKQKESSPIQHKSLEIQQPLPDAFNSFFSLGNSAVDMS